MPRILASCRISSENVFAFFAISVAVVESFLGFVFRHANRVFRVENLIHERRVIAKLEVTDAADKVLQRCEQIDVLGATCQQFRVQLAHGGSTARRAVQTIWLAFFVFLADHFYTEISWSRRLKIVSVEQVCSLQPHNRARLHQTEFCARHAALVTELPESMTRGLIEADAGTQVRLGEHQSAKHVDLCRS